MKPRGVLIVVVSLALSGILMSAGCSSMENLYGKYRYYQSDAYSPAALGEKVTQFVSSVRPYQGSSGAHYLLGKYYQERERHREAIEEFRKVLVTGTDAVNAYNGMGVSYAAMGNFTKAVESYQKALKVNPNLDYVHNNLGFLYLCKGDVDAAVTSFQRAIDINGDNKKARNNLDLALGMKKETVPAVADTLSPEKKTLYAAPVQQAGALRGEEVSKQVSRLIVPASDQSGRPLLIADNQLKNSLPVAVIQPEDKRLSGFGTGEKQVSGLSSAGIEVSNGNGVNRMAKLVGTYLKDNGLRIVRLTNADTFTYPGTKIYYQRGYGSVARDVANRLPKYRDVSEVSSLGRSQVKVKVVIGDDIVPYGFWFPGKKERS